MSTLHYVILSKCPTWFRRMGCNANRFLEYFGSLEQWFLRTPRQRRRRGRRPGDELVVSLKIVTTFNFFSHNGYKSSRC